ncbi:MAG: hypothetical protein IPH46_07735 [Bacteroidetes bacterium]|nr:hypothetical protein [Bacteroidota bacterium]
MNKVFEISITERRKIGQMGLDSFMQGQHNMLDYPVDKLIASLKQKNDSILAELDRWSDIERNEPERFNAIEEKANRTGHSISIQMNDSILEIIYIEDELFALLEMKIIYAFKHLEIKIKQLLFAAYQDPYINRQFKWDTIIQFLRGKNINVKKFGSIRPY